MNRRFIGNARKTPSTATTSIHASMCHHGMILPVTIMYAASAEMSGEVM